MATDGGLGAVYAVCNRTLGEPLALFSTEEMAHGFVRTSAAVRGQTGRFEVIRYPMDAAYASVVCPDAPPEVDAAMDTEPEVPTPAPGPPPSQEQK